MYTKDALSAKTQTSSLLSLQSLFPCKLEEFQTEYHVVGGAHVWGVEKQLRSGSDNGESRAHELRLATLRQPWIPKLILPVAAATAGLEMPAIFTFLQHQET